MTTFRHHPLIGTFVEIQVDDDSIADEVDGVIVGEMERLESICSIYDDTSELSCWRAGSVIDLSSDLTEVLTLGLFWQQQTDGAFNTASRVLTDVWRRAEVDGVEPDRSLLQDTASSIRAPRFAVIDGRILATGDVTAIDLNALAKGWIVDRAAELAHRTFPDVGLVVDAGGDLRHIGPEPIVVGIENPLRPYDNEPPIARVPLRNGGLATSGGARRGFTIGDHRYPHLIDTGTGWCASRHASVTISAPDTATADVIATACGLLDELTALELATDNGCGAVIVRTDGHVIWNDLGHPLT